MGRIGGKGYFMKTFKIYTAGKMYGLSYGEQIRWRLELEHLVRTISDNVIFVHPPHYYRYSDEQPQWNEREAMIWCLSQIRDSDIVVVNLRDIGQSIGTNMELGFIEALNQMSGKHIHVVGIGEPDIEHPWLNEILLHREETLEQAAAYISAYLLI